MSEHEYTRVHVRDLGGKIKVEVVRLHESPPGIDIRFFDSQRDRGVTGEQETLLYRYTPFPGVEAALASLDAEEWPEFDHFRDG